MLTEELKNEAEPIIEAIYNDTFIQGLIHENIEADAIIHYLKADSLYLKEFAKLYAVLIAKTNSRETVEYLLGQMEFLLEGESEAHAVLSQAVGMTYEEITDEGVWYPSADHYIKHMYFNALTRENIAFTLSAMVPCPYVYRRLAEKVMARHTFEADHPYRGWFEFYARDMDDTLDVMQTIIDNEAEKMSEDDLRQIKRNFMESTEHERRFFNMAATKERWMEVGIHV
ncbi:thiaminase II [Salinicoccus roseus]|uniref:Aminopyrimidine aminohydrolase n=1 Tax=Salinicoccus roseus TaxID=45670 RepID=A0A265E9R9_9STAP|nr:thiaminase II [Salinicoccus roseus]MCG7332855.1 thiaminase II [Salinicoccus roseus]OZT78176.1 thiaminase II [Salinicoccus roseus]